jgi:small subunit ribosomal protein S6
MRLYEEVIIVKPDVSEEETKGVVELLSKTVTDQGGTIENVDEWGRRNLAYKVGKYTEGVYFIVKFASNPDTVKEVERRLRVNDAVVKFLTVRLDERLKWVAKRKKRREERAKRKPPVTATPALPANPAAALPGQPAAALPGQPEAPAPAKPAASEQPAVVENVENVEKA